MSSDALKGVLYLGAAVYRRSGNFGWVLGPLLWLVATAAALAHNTLALPLTALVLYFNIAVNMHQRSQLQLWQRRSAELAQFLPAAARNAAPDEVAASLQVQWNDEARKMERLRSEMHFAGRALEQMAGAAQHTADSQRTRVEMIAAASEQITQTMQQIRARGASAMQAFEQVQRMGAAGRDSARMLGADMAAIEASLGETSGAVENLMRRADAIRQFVGKIQGVARQTQLLALNASIEAARAGSNGRGFAVVADEVRALAVNADQATQDIAQVVGEIGAAAQQVHGQVGSHSALLASGAQRSEALAGVLQQLAQQSDDNRAQLDELQSALTEHAQASESLSRELQEINATVAAHSEQAQRLHNITSYMLAISGSAAEAAA